MNLVNIVIPTAYAADAAPVANQAFAGGPMFLLFIIVAIAYVMIWRPQRQRDKEHQNLVASLAVNDEVITNGGIVGKVKALEGTFVALIVAEGVVIKVQKAAVASLLPKGSIK